MASLQIRKFKPVNIKEDTIILLVGKRGTGKSTLLQDISYHLRSKVDFAIGMSPTEDTTQSMGCFIPTSAIYGDYSEATIIEIMELQKNMWRAGRGYHCLIVLDDCCYDKKILRSKVIREIFMNGRHRRITLILSAQYVMDLPPDLRTQVDYIFALRENVVQNRERLWKQFFGFFHKYSDFGATMDECTENYCCLVCDNKTSKGNSIEECVYWYKAVHDLPRFKVGKPFMWSLHSKYYQKPIYNLPKVDFGKKKPKSAAAAASARSSGKKASGITSVVRQDEHGHALSKTL